jgi:hypothetical protein
MRSRFSGLIEALGLKARDTATRDTLAVLATTSAVARRTVFLDGSVILPPIAAQDW